MPGNTGDMTLSSIYAIGGCEDPTLVPRTGPFSCVPAVRGIVVDHVASGQGNQPPTDMDLIWSTPLDEMPSAEVRSIVRWIVDQSRDPGTVEIAAFNSSL